jgi:hypothetical protein
MPYKCFPSLIPAWSYWRQRESRRAAHYLLQRIVVGSPRLFSPECRTPHHMELVNVLCRYAELSEQVVFDTITNSTG